MAEPEYVALCIACGHDPWHGAAMCGKAVTIVVVGLQLDESTIWRGLNYGNIPGNHRNIEIVGACACTGAA